MPKSSSAAACTASLDSCMPEPDRGAGLVVGSVICCQLGTTLALDGVDVRAAEGEIWAVLGPNGAGKTTLLSILGGLRRPTGGRLAICGVDAIASPRAAVKHVGLVQQAVGLYPILTVRENLEFFGGLAEMSGRALQESMVRTGEDLDIGHLLDKRVATLSGGQRRLVHCAAAMVFRPRVLLLDEPTAGLDREARDRLLAALRRLAADGITIFYATHHVGEVEELDAGVMVLERGRVTTRGTVRDLVHRYAASVVELSFDGIAPTLAHGVRGAVEQLGSNVRIVCSEPVETAAHALAGLGGDAARLRGIEIKRPSLESVLAQIGHDRWGESEVPPGDRL